MSFIGIDVAKAQLEFARRPSWETGTVANDDGGIRALVERCQALPPTLILLEATGGYETAVVAALAAAGLSVVVANPVRCGLRESNGAAREDRCARCPGARPLRRAGAARAPSAPG